jgi:hypothetical protein
VFLLLGHLQLLVEVEVEQDMEQEEELEVLYTISL